MRELIAVIDVVNFHAAQNTESYIRTSLKEGKLATPDIDRSSDSLRFYQNIKNKCIKYKQLIESRGIPYLIGSFPQFDVVLDRSQILETLFASDSGLFRGADEGGYPNVSGLVYYFDEAKPDTRVSVSHIYRFEFFPNPHAARPFLIPEGNYYAPMLIQSGPSYRQLLSVAAAIGQLDKFNE